MLPKQEGSQTHIPTDGWRQSKWNNFAKVKGTSYVEILERISVIVTLVSIFYFHLIEKSLTAIHYILYSYSLNAELRRYWIHRLWKYTYYFSVASKKVKSGHFMKFIAKRSSRKITKITPIKGTKGAWNSGKTRQRRANFHLIGE